MHTGQAGISCFETNNYHSVMALQPISFILKNKSFSFFHWLSNISVDKSLGGNNQLWVL